MTDREPFEAADRAVEAALLAVLGERHPGTRWGIEDPDRLVTRQELAALMRVSVPTIDRMRRAGMPALTWGRRLVRFRVSDALAWAETQEPPIEDSDKRGSC